MPKNRKNQAADIRFGPVLKVVLLCFVDWWLGHRLRLAKKPDQPAGLADFRLREATKADKERQQTVDGPDRIFRDRR